MMVHICAHVPHQVSEEPVIYSTTPLDLYLGTSGVSTRESFRISITSSSSDVSWVNFAPEWPGIPDRRSDYRRK